MKKLLNFLAILFLGFPAIAAEVSSYPAATSFSDNDLFYLVTYPYNSTTSSHKITGSSTKQTIYNSISGDLTINASGVSTIANLAVNNTKVATGIDAIKIGGGLISNTEYGYLNGLTGNIQDQIDALPGGTVTTVGVVSANGISAVVANPTTDPSITITLGAITPSSVAASGTVTGSNLSGTNTGNQTTTGVSNRITVSNGTTNPIVDIASGYVGQTTITTVGTITTGTWGGSFSAVSGNNLTHLNPNSIDSGTANIDISGQSATVNTINGKVVQGSNITITGTGTTVDPLVINSSGGATTVNLVDAQSPTSTTPVGANVGTGETTLYAYTIPANTLNADGDSYHFVTWGYNVANPTGTEEVFGYLNGVSIYDGDPLTITNNVGWQLDITVFRSSVSSARIMFNFAGVTGFGQTPTAGSANLSVAADWTSNMPFTLTGQASGTGAASNQILIWAVKSYIDKL